MEDSIPTTSLETAIVEGRAFACSEVLEGGEEPERLVSVERDTVNFAIAVTPIFQPAQATVQFLDRKRTIYGCHHQHQVWTLPYVGAGKRKPSGLPKLRRHRQKAMLLS